MQFANVQSQCSSSVAGSCMCIATEELQDRSSCGISPTRSTELLYYVPHYQGKVRGCKQTPCCFGKLQDAGMAGAGRGTGTLVSEGLAQQGQGPEDSSCLCQLNLGGKGRRWETCTYLPSGGYVICAKQGTPEHNTVHSYVLGVQAVLLSALCFPAVAFMHLPFAGELCQDQTSASYCCCMLPAPWGCGCSAHCCTLLCMHSVLPRL